MNDIEAESQIDEPRLAFLQRPDNMTLESEALPP